MLVALTTGQKLGLAGVGLAFIAFALASSFLLPMRDRDFPGRRGLPWFVAVTAAFFAAMMAAVVVFAAEGEEEEGEAEAAEPAAETGPAPEGDPEAGKAVFASAGCGGCHTLADAGTSGTVGPNLDRSKPSFELAVDRVTNGSGAMPSFADQLSEEQIRDVAAYVSSAAGE